MTTEAFFLVLSSVLGIAQILLAVTAATKKYGVKWNVSSRDAKVPELTGVAARLKRAAENFKETFPFFAAAALLVLVLGKSSTLSVIGAHAYFWARLIYVPIYALDIIYIRTAVWSVSIVGILLMLAALF